MYLFQFLITVHAKAANSNLTNYIFLRLAITTLSIEHIKSPFFKNLEIGLECLKNYKDAENESGAVWYSRDLHSVWEHLLEQTSSLKVTMIHFVDNNY